MTDNLTTYVSGEAHKPVRTTLGQRIVEALEANDLTTADVAAQLGVKTSTLIGWERDKSQPRGNRLTTLAGLLNVSPTWLLSGFGEDPGAEIDDEVGSIRAELMELRGHLRDMADKVDRLVDRLEGLDKL